MKQKLQIDNPVHVSKVKEKEKAEKVLAKAKLIKRKVIFLPQGYSRDFKPKSLL